MNEAPLTLTLHGVTLASTLTILALVLKQHKVWVRLKDRVNILWHHHCTEVTGEPYTSLDSNGH